MCIAVDPDTNTIKDFASALVTADIQVGANVTIGEQAWDGITRKFFRLGAGATAADMVAFGNNKPQWTFGAAGQRRTVIFIGEGAGNAVRAFGASSSNYFGGGNLSVGGATTPTFIAGGTITGSGPAIVAGQKIMFGFLLDYGVSSTAFDAADTAASMRMVTGLTALSPSPGTFNYALGFVGRRNDSSAKQQDKIHAVLIFNELLTQAQLDTLRDDWFGTLLESSGPPDTTPPTLTAPTGTKTGSGTATGTVSTDEGNGTLYYLATINAAETVATVKASGATQGVSAAGTQNVSFVGLSANTTYFAHFVHRDAVGNDSAVASSGSFTTDPSGDTVPPTLTSPTGTATGATTATGSVSTNEGNGTLFRLASTNPSESVATVKAANLTSSVSAAGAQPVSFTGLAASTTYYAHFVHRDAAGNDSAVASSASFTTNANSGNNVRLQPGLYLQRGGLAASRNNLRWRAFLPSHGAVAASGVGTSTNANGQVTIDLNNSPFAVGDWVELQVLDYDAGVAAADRTVLAFSGFVQAIAQA